MHTHRLCWRGSFFVVVIERYLGRGGGTVVWPGGVKVANLFWPKLRGDRNHTNLIVVFALLVERAGRSDVLIRVKCNVLEKNTPNESQLRL